MSGRHFLLFLLIFGSALNLAAQSAPRRTAFLDFSERAQTFSAELAEQFSERKNFRALDPAASLAAARAQEGYKNPFNLSLAEAKNLGAAIDCDFFLIIRSDTVPRSAYGRNDYFEAFAVVFAVSARTGRLVGWEHRQFDADTAAAAEKLRAADLPALAARFAERIETAAAREKTERGAAEIVNIAELPDEREAAETNFRAPAPYRRLTPAYTTAARAAQIEATVDVEVDLNERGAAERVEVVRWAGFDLDEAAIETIKKMQFRPASRDGAAVAVRVLLRYNFRDLEKQK